MKMLNCPCCGGTVYFDAVKDCYICEYCDSPMAASNVNDERMQQMKERANRLFLNFDYEGASALYQNIVSEYPEDAEAYWFLTLCAYGIQYVDDPATGKKVPTCNRTLYASILNNEDYINALECADVICRQSYQETAKYIDQIQRKILDIVAKEAPYDIFLSYKETDENGLRTKEGDIAMDLYYKLTANGYRVFYAPETLKTIAGHEYEPYIFAALNSAKIMLCIGFSHAHFEAPWVKNEWSRFHARKTRNPRLILLTCYNSYLMNGSEIPDKLKSTQAIDMANASTNDLVAQIGQILPKKKEQTAPTTATASVTEMMGGNANALCKRGYVYLEDKEFSDASKYFNKCLDQNPELSKAYWGLLLARLGCCNSEELAMLGKPITETNEYKKAIRFASGAEQDEYLETVERINKKIQLTLNRLTQKQAAVLEGSDILRVLQAQGAELSEAIRQFNEHSQELFAVEKSIYQSLEQCNQVLKPYMDQAQQIRNALKQLQSVEDERSQCPNSEYRYITDQIAQHKQEIADLLATVRRKKQTVECFHTLSQCQHRQNELEALLKADSARIERIYDILEDNHDDLNQVLRDFTPAWQQVRAGDYRLATALMNR